MIDINELRRLARVLRDPVELVVGRPALALATPADQPQVMQRRACSPDHIRRRQPSARCAVDRRKDQVRASTRGAKEPKPQRHDRCIHPSGPHPMNEFCPWKTNKTEGAPE